MKSKLDAAKLDAAKLDAAKLDAAKLDVGVIGAGLAGLTFARSSRNKHKIVLYDKARGVGGRLASRRYKINGQEESFDFGAQFFYAKNIGFKALLRRAIKEKAVARWDGTFAEMQASKVLRTQAWDENYQHYVGSPTMNSFAKYLAKGLQINLNCRVSSVVKGENNKWQLLDEEKQVLAEHDWVVFACPAQQVIEMTPDITSFRQEIQQNRKMIGCYTMMLAFNEPVNLPFHCALVKDANISWVSLEHSKPNRSSLTKLVIHATNKWAEKNITRDKSEIMSDMINHSSEILGIDLKDNIFVDVHRWLYANINRSMATNFYDDEKNKIAAIGDWCIQGRAEAAFISACSLANKYFI